LQEEQQSGLRRKVERIAPWWEIARRLGSEGAREAAALVLR
jgi:hypothetical protein